MMDFVGTKSQPDLYRRAHADLGPLNAKVRIKRLGLYPAAYPGGRIGRERESSITPLSQCWTVMAQYVHDNT